MMGYVSMSPIYYWDMTALIFTLSLIYHSYVEKL